MKNEQLTKKRYNFIRKQATKLLNLSNNKHPFALAYMANVNIVITQLDSLPGFIDQSDITNVTIYINSSLDSYSKKIVCAHELGHYILHKNNNNFQLFDTDIDAPNEFEANLFVKMIMPQVFAKADITKFKTISDFNKFVECQIRYTN